PWWPVTLEARVARSALPHRPTSPPGGRDRVNRARVSTLLFVLWIAVLGARNMVFVRLDVPIVRQPPHLSGSASLEMVLRYYGADSSVARRSRQAFRPQWGATQ